MRYALAVLAFSGALFAQTALQITNDALPQATVGSAYSQQIATTGGACQGTGTATSTIDSGSLPPGLTVVSPAGLKQWAIQGTPTTAGTYTFALHVSFTLDRYYPFVPICTDQATKTLSLTVATGGPPPATFTSDRTQVSTTYRLGHFPPLPETVNLSASGGGAVPFTIQTATNSGSGWLSVSASGSATPASLSISFTPGSLGQGVYTGTVTVTPANGTPLTINVTLTVVTDTAIVLAATPASITFASLAGGAAPAPQTLTVKTAVADTILFLADVVAPPTGKWLTVTPASGATPATLAVSVDPKNLTPGTYSGTITLRVANVPNVSQMIPVTYTIQTAPVGPTISANGVVDAAALGGAIAPGSWVSIFGAALSSTTRSWRDTDFIGGKLPTSLDGVSVTINSKPAPVSYISSTQINVLAPDDSTTGLVAVQVKTPAGTSDSAFVLEQTLAPALFQLRGGANVYAASTHADGSYVAGTALTQAGIAGTPAKPGETIVLYGTGFGPTQPASSLTALVPSALPLANPAELHIRIGGIDSTVVFAGLIGPGLYQFNVVVPPQLADGDQPVVTEMRGLLSRSGVLLPVQH